MPVWFCTSVGGGIFGEGQTAAWRSLGLDAQLHYSVDVGTYWQAKSAFLARIRLRWSMYVSYPLRLRKTVLRAKAGEVFVAVTNPFFLPAMAAWSGRTSGARVVQLVYDLYPDALVFGGACTFGHPVARLAANSTRRAIAECAATVYLGERLRRYAESRYGVARRTEVIAVGTDTSIFDGHEPVQREQKSIKCLYSGHMGKLHDWSTLGDALSGGIPSNLIVELACDGPGARSLKRCLNSVSSKSPKQLLLGETRGNSEWRSVMLSADVAFVTMRCGAERVVMPSKAYSAMAAGQALIAICPLASDLADLISLHDCGWVIEPGDVGGLLKKLQELPSAQDELLQKRRNSWRAARGYYSMEKIGQQWLRLFESLDAN